MLKETTKLLFGGLTLLWILLMGWISVPYLQHFYDKVVHTDSNQTILDTRAQLFLDSGLSDEQWEFLKDVSKLIQYADMMGYKLTAGEIYRTMYQQRENIRNGVSWTYNSRHLKRLAIDLNLFINGRYATDCSSYDVLGEFWESLDESNVWGGRWRHKDCPHFERRK